MVAYHKHMHDNTYMYMKVPNYAMNNKNEVNTDVKK